MRKKTRQLLIASYYPQAEQEMSGLRNYASLYSLLPDLSEGGIRSLVNQHLNNGYLTRVKIGQISAFRLTMAGRYLLTDYYPILSYQKKKTRANKSQLLILMKSPQFDQGFLKLRAWLKANNAMSITRGVYFFEQGVPEQLFKQLVSKYAAAVLIVDINKFSLGNLDAIGDFQQRGKIAFEEAFRLSNQFKLLLNEKTPKKDSSFKSSLVLSQHFLQLFQVMENTKNAPLEEASFAAQILQAFEDFNAAVNILFFSRK